MKKKYNAKEVYQILDSKISALDIIKHRGIYNEAKECVDEIRMSQDKNGMLKHFGILGMKWGIRRYQNKDGTLTAEGKKRYASTPAVIAAKGAITKFKNMPDTDPDVVRLNKLYKKTYGDPKIGNTDMADNRFWDAVDSDIAKINRDRSIRMGSEKRKEFAKAYNSLRGISNYPDDYLVKNLKGTNEQKEKLRQKLREFDDFFMSPKVTAALYKFYDDDLEDGIDDVLPDYTPEEIYKILVDDM